MCKDTVCARIPNDEMNEKREALCAMMRNNDRDMKKEMFDFEKA